jgi:hypothetical protein
MADSTTSAPSGRFDLLLALIMAAAAVCTAWAGFESTKWSGTQANSYAEASAARIEADKSSTRAGQERLADVVTFTQWLSALNEEIIANPSARPGEDYRPPEGTISAFIYQRFRPEFQPAMDAWLDSQPFVDPSAPPTPFVLPEYVIAADEDAARLEAQADGFAKEAREANQLADNYVLTAVLFALVLFFAAIGDRTRGRRAQLLLFIFAAVGLLVTVGVLATFPVEF